jgi:hypothetical protein
MRAIGDILRLRWNWMNRRYASPALSGIFLADIPKVSNDYRPNLV